MPSADAIRAIRKSSRGSHARHTAVGRPPRAYVLRYSTGTGHPVYGIQYAGTRYIGRFLYRYLPHVPTVPYWYLLGGVVAQHTGKQQLLYVLYVSFATAAIDYSKLAGEARLVSPSSQINPTS